MTRGSQQSPAVTWGGRGGGNTRIAGVGLRWPCAGLWNAAWSFSIADYYIIRRVRLFFFFSIHQALQEHAFRWAEVHYSSISS